jgi:hypothetical protein
MLFGREAPVPEPTRVALELVFGECIDHVRVIEHSLYARLHVSNNATTRRRRIYLRGSAKAFFQKPVLVLHEYCHVLKQWQPQSLTLTRYLFESARRGYWNNRYEIEARQFAADNCEKFEQLLRSGTAATS